MSLDALGVVSRPPGRSISAAESGARILEPLVQLESQDEPAHELDREEQGRLVSDFPALAPYVFHPARPEHRSGQLVRRRLEILQYEPLVEVVVALARPGEHR